MKKAAWRKEHATLVKELYDLLANTEDNTNYFKRLVWANEWIAHQLTGFELNTVHEEGENENMRNAVKGTYRNQPTYCTVNAIGDCPYCDKNMICHIDNPVEDCDDFNTFFETWQDWIDAGDPK